MRRIGALLVVIAAVLLAGAWFVLGRSGVAATSAVDPDVTITCDAWTSVSPEACGSWGDAILAQGAPSHTFEMDDLAHLAISRPTFGLDSACRVEYFLERYASDPAWTDEIPCGGG
ncbi:MAG: hypothetical protein ABI534_03810 [Chloroflexota bacterium]